MAGKKRHIRPLALCIFRRGDLILVAEGQDEVAGRSFYRPIGGRIEFGERAADTVVREVMEEIEQEVAELRYLGTLENIFTYRGQMGHEIVLIFDGIFTDPAMDDSSLEIAGVDDDDDGGELLFIATWKPLDFFRGPGAPPLYPDGLLELLDRG